MMESSTIVIIGMLFFPIMLGASMGYLFLAIGKTLSRWVESWTW